MSPFTRRQVILAGSLGAAATTWPVRRALALDVIEPDLTRDTFNGLAAFLLPGNDRYSEQQGVTAAGPGGVAAGSADLVIHTLDHVLSASVLGVSVAVPASALVAGMMNQVALEVRPLALDPLFLSPFARLRFADKARVIRRMEQDSVYTTIEAVRYVSRVVPALGAFASFAEAGVYDRARQRLTTMPVGWRISGYSGPSAGTAGFVGYYRGHRSAQGAS